ncbi:hypothetical protein GC584_06115 [Corynebacterium sp. zg912]|uniref:Uncharacterized protein n=1 Tax=Corynebacterium wankanglinii TaxID=2735136 RepID=A0A7H0K7Y2_9CORY|nr:MULTISPECIES: hypothetical protein [Corynebacterium]MBA1837550.1 hypothetical protein [Corynebacterium wankanglinii]MCR5928994.1 hypothetical protein [Corynebacterium sp. zg912]QNP93398.1 hypothetical protein IA203_05585 [Corynebacterium wankanglinii]
MTTPLHWDKKKADFSMGIVFGVMFFVVFGLMMDDMLLGAGIGVAFFVAFGLLPDKRAADFDGQTLRLVDKKETTELDAASIADVIISESGAMVVKTELGESYSVESEGDNRGLQDFAEKLRAELALN